MIKNSLIIFALFNPTLFLADEDKSNLTREMTMIKSCQELKTEEVKEGVICQTSKGFNFSRTKDGWEDIQSGLTWFDENRLSISYEKALKFCKDKDRDLPTGWPEYYNGKRGFTDDEENYPIIIKFKVNWFPNHDSDFVMANKHGIKEVFAGKNSWWGLYWSKSEVHYSSFCSMTLAYYFDPDSHYGSIDWGNESCSSGDYNYAVRCVSRP